ncbi:MAG: hypothetical protein Q7P63_05815 [Verrucomicrobiota bacterium JB022]|nr:hypothetical protein [Verrucomicrobiota bacterium JB022]
MRVTSDTLSRNILPQLNQLQARRQQLQSTIASGVKLSNASDAPADAAQVARMSTAQQAAVNYRRNADMATTQIKTSDQQLALLGKFHDQTNGLLEGYNQDPSAEQQAATVETLNELIEQTVTVLNDKLNDQPLFGADGTSTTPFAIARDADGNITSFTYEGGTGDWKLPASASTQISAATNGATNASLADWANQLIALRDAVATGERTAVDTASNNFDLAEDNLMLAQVELGGKLARAEAVRSSESEMFNLRQDGINQRTQANVTEAIVQFQQVNQAYQASLQAASLTMNMSLLDFI